MLTPGSESGLRKSGIDILSQIPRIWSTVGRITSAFPASNFCVIGFSGASTVLRNHDRGKFDADRGWALKENSRSGSLTQQQLDCFEVAYMMPL